MNDFISYVKNVLEEKDLTVEKLFKDGVVSQNTFYKYKHRNPNLQTLIKIANYLNVTIDYLFEFNDENNFHKYSMDQSGFYLKLLELIKTSNLSIRQFCKNLNYSKDNVNRYKNGVEPSLRTLIEIAKYFNCSIDDLLSKTV